MKRRLILPAYGVFVVVLISAVLTGCPSNNQVTLPPPGTLPLGTLYTANGTVGGPGDGVISIYKLPLSSASTRVGSFTVPGTFAPNLNGICTDSSGRLFIPDSDNSVVRVYTPPIGNGATPAFSLSVATPFDCAVDSAGNLYVSTSSNVAAFTAPVQSGSTPSRTITSGMVSPAGVGTDTSGNLYVAQGTGNTSYSNYAGGNTLSATFGTQVDAFGETVGPDTKLYVANGMTEGNIDVFTTPVSNAQVRSNHITLPGTTASRAYLIKFDASGNMYVTAQTSGGSELLVLAPPFTGASLATLTSGQAFGFEGVALGP